MHETEAAKSPSAAAAFREVGYEKGARTSDQHGLNGAVPAYEEPYLTSGFKRQVCKVAREFRGDDLVRGDLPPAQVLKALANRGFKSGCVAD